MHWSCLKNAVRSDVSICVLCMFMVVVCCLSQRKQGIGGGVSLTYPPLLLETLRSLYPEGVKNYQPSSRRVSSNDLIVQHPFVYNSQFFCIRRVNSMMSLWRSSSKSMHIFSVMPDLPELERKHS